MSPEEKYKEDIAKLKEAINTKNINLKDIEKELNISRTMLWRYLNEKIEIPYKKYLKIKSIVDACA